MHSVQLTRLTDWWMYPRSRLLAFRSDPKIFLLNIFFVFFILAKQSYGIRILFTGRDLARIYWKCISFQNLGILLWRTHQLYFKNCFENGECSKFNQKINTKSRTFHGSLLCQEHFDYYLLSRSKRKYSSPSDEKIPNGNQP